MNSPCVSKAQARKSPSTSKSSTADEVVAQCLLPEVKIFNSDDCCGECDGGSDVPEQRSAIHDRVLMLALIIGAGFGRRRFIAE